MIDDAFAFEIVFEHVPADICEVAPRRHDSSKDERVPEALFKGVALACACDKLGDLGGGGAEKVL